MPTPNWNFPIEAETLAASLAPISLKSNEISLLGESLVAYPPLSVRLRPGADADQLPFSSHPVEWFSRGRTLTDSNRPAQYPLFGTGTYYVQDAGSMLALHLLQGLPGDRFCDLCGSPGGKATGIAEQLEMRQAGWLLVNEPVRSRLAPLQLNLHRHGATRYLLTNKDPDNLAAELADAFDVVVVDAPCSGQSMIGRAKQQASAFDPRVVEHCASRQMRILDAACRLVRPGGSLIYSTCTFAYAENEAQVTRILDTHSDWELYGADELRPWESTVLANTYRTWPHRDPCAGSFAARLRRRGDSSEPVDLDEPIVSSRRRRKSKKGVTEELPQELNAWGSLPVAHHRAQGDRVVGWSLAPPAELLAVADDGPELMFRKGSTWFPAYALAMRRDSQWQPAQRWEVDEQAARQYLRGETIPCSLRGWAVVEYSGNALGWIKADSRVGKNHLPKPARLNC